MSHAVTYSERTLDEAINHYVPQKNQGKALGRHVYNTIDWAFSCNPLARRAADAAAVIFSTMVRPPISVDTCLSIAASFRMAAVVRVVWHFVNTVPKLKTQDEKDVPKTWPQIAQELAGIFSVTLYAGLFATGRMALKAPADLFDAATSALELANAIQDLSYATQLKTQTQDKINRIEQLNAQQVEQQKKGAEDVTASSAASRSQELASKWGDLPTKREIFDAKIQYAAIQALKAFCSVLSAFAAYTMALPAFTVLTLGVSGIALSAIARVYKANLDFKLPNLTAVKFVIA